MGHSISFWLQRQVTEDKITQLNKLESGKDETTQTVGLRKPVILNNQLDKYAHEIYSHRNIPWFSPILLIAHSPSNNLRGLKIKR